MEIKTAQMEKVIKIIGVIGDGTEKNPARRIIVYYTLDGRMIGEFCPDIISETEAHALWLSNNQ